MGVLIGIIINLFTTSFGKIFSTLAVRLPIVLAYIAIIVTLYTAFLFTANSIISGIGVTVPEQVTMVWGWVMPSNTVSILSALYFARLVKWAHTKHLRIVNKKVEILRN